MAEKFEQATVRKHLLGVVVDHFMKGKITCPHTHQLGCELVALVASYREEDRRLFPEVYLLADEANDLLAVLAPGAQPLCLGSTEIDPSANAELEARKLARTALKNCAALAIDGWVVYIQKKRNSFNYGLFRPATHSYSMGADASLAGSGLPAAIIRNCAENTVEVVDSVGTRLEVSLTVSSPSTVPLSNQIAIFAETACQDVSADCREHATVYLSRILTEFLRSSHGALLAVSPHDKPLESQKFSDGVIFVKPVCLVDCLIAAIKGHGGDSDSQLRSHESLLRGMIMSDGVTIFGTDGSIKGFRVFVQTTSAKSGDSTGKVTGGARSRAFGVLKSYLRDPLRAVLFRSQDGRTEVVTDHD